MKEKKINLKIVLSILVLIIVFLMFSHFFFKKSVNLKTTYNFNYSENSKIDYKVYLNKNTYYEEDYLNEGMHYISGLINYFDVDFNYNLSSDTSFNHKATYDLTADVIITERNGDKVLFTKSDVLIDDRKIDKDNIKENIIKENIKIDYAKYNEISDNFKKEYALSVNSYLLVNLKVHNLITTKKVDNINETSSISLKIPLSQNTIGAEKNLVENDNVKTFTTNNEIINKTFFVIYVVLIILSVLLFIILIYNLKNLFVSSKTPYQKTLSKILKEYDRAIVKTKENTYGIKKYKIIEIENIDELIDVRDNLNSMILHIEKKKNKESWFIIIDEKTLYRYILK